MKKTEYGNDARAQLSSGVNKLARAVSATLGPSGRNVLIKLKDHDPFSTKDGVTVAGAFSSNDPIEQVAIEAVQKVSSDTDSKTGDGTTTATIIAQHILSKGLEFPKHLNLLDIKKGIDKATQEVVDKLIENKIDCKGKENLLKVAMVSSNYDEEVSKAVIDAFDISGKQGIVNIKRSRDNITYVNSVDGMNLPTGYLSRGFINDYENEICEFEKTMIFMTNLKINEVTPNFEYVLNHASKNNIAILIICKDMDILVQNMLIENKRNGSLKVCVCRAPGFGNEQESLLYDIGTALGNDPFIEGVGMDFESLDPETALNRISFSDKIFVSEQSVSIHANKECKKAMEARADILRETLEVKHNAYEKSQIQTRISRLSDGIAFINIGASTDLEFIEKQHRIQDALYAVKSAYNEGVVPGGGAALFSISKMLSFPKNKSEAYGYKIISEAIRMPLIKICSNAGVEIYEELYDEGKIILFFKKLFSLNDNNIIDSETVSYIENNFNYGYNVKNGVVQNMIDHNVIDPVKVTRIAVENAASVSGLLLTTECVIVKKENVYKTANEYE